MRFHVCSSLGEKRRTGFRQHTLIVWSASLPPAPSRYAVGGQPMSAVWRVRRRARGAAYGRSGKAGKVCSLATKRNERRECLCITDRAGGEDAMKRATGAGAARPGNTNPATQFLQQHYIESSATAASSPKTRIVRKYRIVRRPPRPMVS